MKASFITALLMFTVAVNGLGQNQPAPDKPAAQTRDAPPPASSKDQGLWQTLTPSDEEFSVAMPGITFNTTENRQAGDQHLTINSYQYQVGDTYYSVDSTSGLYQLPQLTDREKLDVYGKIILRSVQGALENGGHKFTASEPRDLTLDGFPGREYRLVNAGGTHSVVLRCYITKRKFYVLTASTPGSNKQEMERVLSSFTFERKGPVQVYERHPSSKPGAGMDIDPALLKNLPSPGYGAPPNWLDTNIAPAPGTGGGIGTGSGVGVGPGEGGGDGRPGGSSGREDRKRAGDNPTGHDRIFRETEVSQRAQILSQPQPGYTEEAKKNKVTGVVRISLVLNANGQVSNIIADGDWV